MNPHTIYTKRLQITVATGGVPELFEIDAPLYGRVVSLVIAKLENRSGVTLSANLYDREEAAGLSADSTDDNTDDANLLQVAEAHRIVPTQSGTNGVLAAYGLHGYYRNCDEPIAGNAQLQKPRLWLELTASVSGAYDVAVTVIGTY